ncbi:MAG: IS200/IS605 family transposase [Dehalococcoidia bacterium]
MELQPMERIYHVWFSTKGRSNALEGEVGDDIKEILRDIAQRTGIQMMAVEASIDHVHLLLRLTGERTLPSAMHQLKGASARAIFVRCPDLKLDLGHDSFWQKGYGWRRIEQSEVNTVRNYIRTQRERPHRHDV